MKRLFGTWLLLFTFSNNYAQNYLKNWYFGYGTDGISFVNNIPQKLSDKAFQVGFEGMIVVNDPQSGNLLFYSDGDKVIDKNHHVMTNGSGLTGHFSGAQCVQSCPVPGTCAKKFYLFTNSAWDFISGAISYSIVDFTTDPLGIVTNKNTVFWAGPSDQGMCLINKPNSNDFWLVANEYATATYNVWPLTASGIGTLASYTFSNTGSSYQMNYDKTARKLSVTGWGNKHVTLIDFNDNTGILSNEIQLGIGFGDCFATRFSPDGTKLYAGVTPFGLGNPTLYQYDFNANRWTDMNTCCYAHDLKMGPDGKMYHIHTYYSTQPIAVIDFPNLSAVGNACNYHTIAFSTPFNGEVRRFPETLILPEPPAANIDRVTMSAASISIPVLANDADPQGDPISLTTILSAPAYGTAVISGNNINYTGNPNVCGRTDTLIYGISDNNCGTDTAIVLIRLPECVASISCNNWLGTPSQPSYAEVGDINITGDKITVEATFNRTTPFSGGMLYAGDLVSKHNTPSECNYLLRPSDAEITTSNGYFRTPDICDIELNKTYHVAMVYDGSTLKFYRNGFLMSQVAATGTLFQNSWKTRIGWYEPQGANTNFIGYINEVRIWNVAKTQAQINASINTSLSNPATQPGLVAYYTFDNLINKQGNAAYNGILGGSASVNNINTNCLLSTDSCTVISSVCNNWLSTPSVSSAVNIGDLDITGDQITVEANINRTQPYVPGGLDNSEGDVVSKHNTPSDVNYLLRPNHAYITTTNGFFATPDICDLKLNKTYHVAMVYDGSSLKFYRDGFLMSQVAATGNLILNNWNTRIGHYDPDFWGTQFIGYTNEVKIWNVARTQAQIRAYMNTPLPNPATQAGLLAYYQFDNLLNKQGNATFNGVINGSASINTTNTSCNFIPDSCNVIVNAPASSIIINTYTPVIAFNPCVNKITVEDASTFNIGDTVLMIQMKGAVIDSSNTALFGNITAYKNAGNYEFNYVKSKAGNIVELKNVLLRQYDVPAGKVQLIRVPYYKSVTFTDTLTCLPWNGKVGGVLVFNVLDTLKLNNDINVSGKGFNGGRGQNYNTGATNCNQNDFFYPLGNVFAAAKGEGIAEISLQKQAGRGKIANGGGGGNDHNAGGGGGSNANSGGKGGDEYNLCAGGPLPNGGIAGANLANYTTNNKIYLGGGGGSGHANDPSSNPFTAAGGNGGGLVIITSNYLQSNNYKINSNGAAAAACVAGGNCNDGAGGGGAGGTILLNITNYLDNINLFTNGGNGANTGPLPTFLTGPGGGGSAGVIWFKQSLNPIGAAITLQGGNNGVNTTAGNNAWGALPGTNGITFNNLFLPITSVPFKKNIDSVKIKDSITSCRKFDFKGLAFVESSAINQWQWTFGDNAGAITQNTSHTYSSAGTYNVKLVVTDINGCKDSILKQIVVVNCTLSASTIINTYTPVIAFNPCENKITVKDASTFNSGDTVLMIQMKGAIIDSSNNPAFGTITNNKNAGNYEFNYVKNKAGNIIELKNNLTRQYDIPLGKVQLIRVPYYKSVQFSDTLTCLAWDGEKGGVLVLNAKDTVDLNNDIDVSGKGFKGGIGINTNQPAFNCSENNFYYPPNGDLAAPKAESIAEISVSKSYGKGHLANAGGGGNSHNGGGGGGANAANGGKGGFQFEGSSCSATAPFDNGGRPGSSLPYDNTNNKIYMGGGGGAGHTNNAEDFLSAGGNGGGIIILSTNVLKGNNKNIVSKGTDGTPCAAANTSGCHEGMAGGGAGGAILIDIKQSISASFFDAAGGNGGDMVANSGLGRVGPGGGGGAGVCWFSSPSVPTGISTLLNGGKNGVCVSYGNDSWGAIAGQNGFNLFNLKIPVDTILFKNNIDSVRIKDSATNCSSFDFKGLAFINSAAINQWQWTFGDNTGASSQNTSHTYTSAGTYNVKLVVTDINGCKDSVIKSVTTFGLTSDFYYTQAACNPFTIQFLGVNPGGIIGGWEIGPAIISNTNNPVYTFTTSGNYIVKYIVTNGLCTDTITKIIPLGIIPADIIITPDTTICINSTKQLQTITSLDFCWSPTSFLDNPALPNPVTTTPQTITYSFTAAIEGNNLVTNPAFSNGNTGFTSQYNPVNTNTAPGEYFVGTNPQIWNTALTTCTDHTSGTGNMLLVNADVIPNINVWTQTITVSPNTNYSFGTWLQSISATNPIQIGFSINGTNADTIITANSTPCNWQKFYTNWNSGNKTTAIISIVNKNTQGSFFALDDISFASVLIKRDSVIISIDSPFVNTIDDTATCRGVQIQLAATGAVSYQWQPSAGLNNPSSANPVASPSDTIKYYVTGTNIHNCTATDSVTIAIKPSPVVLKTADTSICKNTPVQLNVSGGDSYLWQADSTLSNDTIPNPIVKPVATTTYYVQTKSAGFLCEARDSIKIPIKSSGRFTISPPDTICAKSSVMLNTTGGNTFNWQPANLLNNPTIASPIATPKVTTTFTVNISDSVCGDTAVLRTTITAIPLPNIRASKSNDIDCFDLSAKLNVTGGSGPYTWTGAINGPLFLSDSSIANPIAFPSITKTYLVTGIDINTFCKNTDSVQVLVYQGNNPMFWIPNAFSPNNGDNLNNCFKVVPRSRLKYFELYIYNRWGNKVFETKDVTECWDGTYKGQPQDPGNFVYYIKASNDCKDDFIKGNLLLIR